MRDNPSQKIDVMLDGILRAAGVALENYRDVQLDEVRAAARKLYQLGFDEGVQDGAEKRSSCE